MSRLEEIDRIASWPVECIELVIEVVQERIDAAEVEVMHQKTVRDKFKEALAIHKREGRHEKP